MERLNDIMGRTTQRRQHYSEQRSPQSQGQQAQQSPRPAQPQYGQQQTNTRPVSRPPLREQNARQGQQRPYVPQQQSQAMPSKRVQQEPTGYEERSYGPPPTARPVPTRPPLREQNQSQRPAMNRSTAYQPQRQERQSMQEQPIVHPLQTRPVHVYHQADEYAFSPVVQADVVEDWEDDEDEEGMQYGDWEEGESEVVIYQRPPSEPQTRPRGVASTPSRNDYGQAYPQHPLVTRELPRPSSNANMQGTRSLRDAQQMQPPVPPTRVQEIQPHRTTQPLERRVITEAGRERTVTQGQVQQQMQQRPLRQIVPQPNGQVREQAVMPYHTSTMLPEVMPLAPTKSACPRCKGAGYLRANVPFGHPNFGKPIACECKEAEKKEKRRQQLRDMSNMDAFRHCDFRSFNPHLPGTQEAFQAALGFAQNPEGWLFLIGPNGCGKTHLAAAIANQSLEEGAVVLFAVVPDLLDHLRAAFAPNATEVYDQLFAKMREAELLILDDLGAQQSSSWANEKLFQLLNYRYNMGMPTVITANPKGLQGVDERIRSRLSDISLVETVVLERAKDYRPNHPRRD